jgi:hypothetical protein
MSRTLKDMQEQLAMSVKEEDTYTIYKHVTHTQGYARASAVDILARICFPCSFDRIWKSYGGGRYSAN